MDFFWQISMTPLKNNDFENDSEKDRICRFLLDIKLGTESKIFYSEVKIFSHFNIKPQKTRKQLKFDQKIKLIFKGRT